MNKYLFVIFFLPVLAQAAIVPVESGTYLINETQTNSRIDYTIAGGSTDNPILAFAVGFYGFGSAESYAGIDNIDILGGAVALSSFDWDNTSLSVVGNRPSALDFSFGFQGINATANEFFGLSWAEFLAFDTSTPNYAAIFLTVGGISSQFPVGGFFVEGGPTLATPTIIQTSNGVISGGPAGQANTINSLGTVPEPAVIWLLGSGLIGLIGMRKKSVITGVRYKLNSNI